MLRKDKACHKGISVIENKYGDGLTEKNIENFYTSFLDIQVLRYIFENELKVLYSF